MQRILHFLFYAIGLIVFVLGSTLFVLDHKESIAREHALRAPLLHEAMKATSSSTRTKATTSTTVTQNQKLTPPAPTPKPKVTTPTPPTSTVLPVSKTVERSTPIVEAKTPAPTIATSSLATTSVPTLQKIANATLAIPSNVGALNQADIWALTNAERVKAGFTPLTFSTKLSDIAIAKAKDMNARQYFAHVSPSGIDIGMLAVEFGYKYLNIGENLALGNFDSSQDVVTGWMNSPGHRANILHTSYTEIGIGVILGTYEGRTVWFAVQEFGRPQSSCPQADQDLKQRIASYQEQLRTLEGALAILRSEIETSGLSQAEYNTKANEYNTLVARYNNVVAITKQDIAVYNAQADVYNACLGVK